MEIKNRTKVIDLMEEMEGEIFKKIDALDRDKPNADSEDDDLNQALDNIEEAVDLIKSLDSI